MQETSQIGDVNYGRTLRRSHHRRISAAGERESQRSWLDRSFVVVGAVSIFVAAGDEARHSCESRAVVGSEEAHQATEPFLYG
jgi:hypothetical protein